MMESLKIWRELTAAVQSGQPIVMATIVRRAGSSPRDVGARMLIFSDGKISGTIGGGKFEHLVIQDSLELLKSEQSCLLKTYSFSQHGENAIGMTCGGEAEVFLEAYRSPSRLYIYGGGHVGRELTRLAAGSNFLVTVVDDRPELLAELGTETHVHQAEPGYSGGLPSVDENSYLVIVTRSHESDRVVLGHYVGQPCRYVGMMGSKAKKTQVFEWLTKSGVASEQLERVHTPIGIEINAEGPYEIAISILAELIAARNRITTA